eukprot:Blabericola_migrator_1__534@NODE_112_length_13896_cov_27_724275_g100_i0_p10_GENE_NODE_112_length_13896_cov_27_724275_g100_i0NODE_112_length_13896_cov_27_724275_g100_i0_p10_ORF_typecomplete_len116_score7_42_NODE_112_length_13896_cov_27_724275_g100_i0979210139
MRFLFTGYNATVVGGEYVSRMISVRYRTMKIEDPPAAPEGLRFCRLAWVVWKPPGDWGYFPSDTASLAAMKTWGRIESDMSEPWMSKHNNTQGGSRSASCNLLGSPQALILAGGT